MSKTQYYDSTGVSTFDPLRIKVPAGSINSPGDIDLTEEGPGGFVEYAAANSATENVVQIPNAASALKDSILAQNAGATVMTATGALRATTNLIGGEAVIPSAAGTTVLTVTSAGTQIVTGVTTQTFTLPVVTTLLQAGVTYRIVNLSTGAVTVNSSGGNAVQVITAGGTAWVTNNKITADTTAAAWDATFCPAVTQSITNGDTRPVSSDAVFDALALKIGGNATDNLGYLNIPQNSQSDSYTCVLADSGKHIYETGASKTVTIPANASVAYPIGTVLTFIATDAGGCSIAITSDTMTLADSTTTGTRTLAQNGIASAVKITSTAWLISGTGLS